MKLTTRYLGLELDHPFTPGASPMADTLDSVRQLEDAGASAIVMRSLFEEQILHVRFGSSGFAFGPDEYLEQLRRIKARVSLPVIASINGTTTEGWLKYARLLQRAEADAVKAIMAGADAVQMVSALLENGVQYLTVVRKEFERWADSHGYESIDQIRDSMSLAHASNPRASERKNYLRVLQSWKRAV